MFELYSSQLINNFYYEIYKMLSLTDTKVSEVWYELSELDFFKKFHTYELYDFLNNFDFITIKKGKYGVKYISINKVIFVLECITIMQLDLKVASKLLDYAGFEALIKEILLKNAYKVIVNFRFSDKSKLSKKTTQKRYEIDVIGIYQKFILIIDAKHWQRRDPYSTLNKAANLQYQRVRAIKNNPEIISKLIYRLLGINPHLKNRLPLKLIPIMVTLEDSGCKLNEDQIPLVSIDNLNNFLLNLEKYSHDFRCIEIKTVNIQKQLK